MSFFEKQRKNRSYVYFQAYDDGNRTVVYLGPRDELSTWEKAEKLFMEYLDKRLAYFYAQVPGELKNRVQPKEGIRRLPEAEVKPQVKPIEAERIVPLLVNPRHLKAPRAKKHRKKHAQEDA